MTAQPLVCPGCIEARAYARSLGIAVGEVRCSVCATRRADRPARRAPPGAPRNALLSLLRDCAAMATWDGRTAPAPTSLKRPDEGGEVRAAGAPSSDPPDWLLERRSPMERAADLRAKLDRLAADARARDAADARAFAWLWVVACFAAFADETGYPMPEPPELEPRAPSVERGAAVIAWLVPRARVLLDSAGSQGTPLEKGLPEQIAEAFTAPAQWAAWHPLSPARPVSADSRPEPAMPPAVREGDAPLAPATRLDDGASAWAREQHGLAVLAYPGELRRWARDGADARALGLLAWVAWLLAYAAWVNRDAVHEHELREHEVAVKRHRAALQAGRDGARAHGRSLLDLAVSVWFGAVDSG